MAREHNIVSIDPDDATPGVVYLEDALKNHQSVEGVEAKVFSIHPCYYLIPQLLHGMNYILKWPIGRITEVSIDIGMDNFMRRYGESVAVIEEVRADILLHGGDWSDKEFAFNRLRDDFHTSKMVAVGGADSGDGDGEMRPGGGDYRRQPPPYAADSYLVRVGAE